MKDREHEEWLEDRAAGKAAAKKSLKLKPLVTKKAEEKKRTDGNEEEETAVRSWVID